MKEKELKIITHGKVCIENLSEAEQHSFYMEMLYVNQIKMDLFWLIGGECDGME